jgi:hypothetical protein
MAYISGMTIWQLWPFIAATVLGNALSFSFFIAALRCSQLQKAGAKDDELPWWVYLGLIAAPVVMSIGIALLD